MEHGSRAVSFRVLQPLGDEQLSFNVRLHELMRKQGGRALRATQNGHIKLYRNSKPTLATTADGRCVIEFSFLVMKFSKKGNEDRFSGLCSISSTLTRGTSTASDTAQRWDSTWLQLEGHTGVAGSSTESSNSKPSVWQDGVLLSGTGVRASPYRGANKAFTIQMVVGKNLIPDASMCEWGPPAFEGEPSGGAPAKRGLHGSESDEHKLAPRQLRQAREQSASKRRRAAGASHFECDSVPFHGIPALDLLPLLVSDLKQCRGGGGAGEAEQAVDTRAVDQLIERACALRRDVESAPAAAAAAASAGAGTGAAAAELARLARSFLSPAAQTALDGNPARALLLALKPQLAAGASASSAGGAS